MKPVVSISGWRASRRSRPSSQTRAACLRSSYRSSNQRLVRVCSIAKCCTIRQRVISGRSRGVGGSGVPCGRRRDQLNGELRVLGLNEQSQGQGPEQQRSDNTVHENPTVQAARGTSMTRHEHHESSGTTEQKGGRKGGRKGEKRGH